MPSAYKGLNGDKTCRIYKLSHVSKVGGWQRLVARALRYHFNISRHEATVTYCKQLCGNLIDS